MKRTLQVLFVILLGSFIEVYAQKEDVGEKSVPEAIRKDLLSRFPDARGRSWQLKKGEYEVDFYKDRVKYGVKYGKENEWKRTSWEIKENEVPSVVRDAYAKSEYKDWELDKTKSVTNKDHKQLYLLKVEKGTREASLIYKPDGELLKVEEKE